MSRPRLGRTPEERNYLGEAGGGEAGWVDYDFAVIRAVPHVHLDAHVNVGVVLHARTAEYLEALVLMDPAALRARVPGADVEVLARYLEAHAGVARGDERFGPIALAPPSERFHWLTAPRSDVVQCSGVHSGRSRDPAATLRDLFRQYVGRDG